jgi:NADPH-dependent 2,4-dienoyl-CoA reductase/sulfur reductase-like enzyme
VRTFELVIVGGGLASARAIKSYREAGGEGAIALFSRDTTLPYHRPPLSKRFLRGETVAAPLVEDERFYVGHGVELLLETEVTAVDPHRRIVEAGRDRFRYGKLLLATGARPRRLQVPGAELDGVFSLRSLDDSRAIRDAAVSASRAVVVGAGFIGMEVAASLRQLRLDVTLIHVGDRLFDQLGVEELSEGLDELYRDQGVELALGQAVVAFEGKERVEAVRTDLGRFESDLVVVGVGVEPVTDFLEGSGIALADGVLVDDRFESSVPGVYAAGDVARFFDPLFGTYRRLEHWSNANYQGAEVGKVLAGAGGGYDTLSSFFTEVFGISVKVFGDARRDAHVVTEGSLADRDLRALYADERGEIVGALAVGQSEEAEESLKRLIAEHAALEVTWPSSLTPA